MSAFSEKWRNVLAEWLQISDCWPISRYILLTMLDGVSHRYYYWLHFTALLRRFPDIVQSTLLILFCTMCASPFGFLGCLQNKSDETQICYTFVLIPPKMVLPFPNATDYRKSETNLSIYNVYVTLLPNLRGVQQTTDGYQGVASVPDISSFEILSALLTASQTCSQTAFVSWKVCMLS